MKKTLLLMAVSMAAMTQLSAQAVWMAPYVMYEKASEDGNYFVASDGEGSVYIFDKAANDYTVFEVSDDGSEYYSVGFGNVFSGDNVMVGNMNEYTPGIMKEGQWTALPLQEGDATPGKSNSADGISLDGKYICGGIAAAATMSIDADDLMMVPVLWTRGEDGTYGDYTVLPHPTKDFTGRLPQYVTARSVSDDGKTVVGMITDWSGFYIMPIVYRQNAAGEWNYTVVGAEQIYDTSVQFPAYPSYEPKEPEAENYISAEDYARFYAAYKAYEDSIDHYYEAYDYDWYPKYYPKVADFLTGDAAATYAALLATYWAERTQYNDSVEAFNDVFDDPSVVYNRSFEFNNIYVSRDGKYLATTIKWIEEDPDPDSWYGFLEVYKPCRFNIADADNATYEMANITEALCSSIMNDGSVLYVTPYMSYLRQTEVWAVGEDKGTNLYDYIAARHGLAAAEMAQVLTFTSLEDGSTTLYTGTACANGTGTLFYSWLADAWGELEGFDPYLFSYFVDMTVEDTVGPTGVEQIATEAAACDGKKFVNGSFVICRQGKNFDLLGRGK